MTAELNSVGVRPVDIGRYSTYGRSGNPPCTGARTPCPSPSTTSSTPSTRRGSRSCTAPSSTSTWCETCASTATAVALEVTLTVAGCPLRNEIQRGSPNAARRASGSPTSTSSFGVMTDEQRADAAREAARRPVRHRRAARPPTATPRAAPSRSPIPRAPPACCSIASGKGGVGQVVGHHQPRRRARPARPGRRRHRRRRVGLLDPADARRRAPSRGHRLDARPARGRRRALHLDGVLRQGGPAGHLAGPDAPQGPRAVPHRRVLGRARLPPRRPAARHRRHLAVARAVPARGPRSTSSPRRSPPPRRWPSAPGSWRRR